jgi:phosphate transport system permease protein
MTRASGTQASRRTRGSVHWQDRLAGVAITVGGVTVIASVFAIGIYLAIVAIPLFLRAHVEPRTSGSVTPPIAARALFVDEHGLSALVLDQAGVVRTLVLGDGTIVGEQSVLAEGKKATAWSWSAEGSLLAVGYADGTIQFGSVEFQTELVASSEVPGPIEALAPGASAVWRPEGSGASGLGGVISRMNEREFRVVRPMVNLAPPVELTHGDGAVERLAYAKSGDAEMIVALRADGSMSLDRVTTIRPLGGGPSRVSLEATPIEPALPRDRGRPEAIYATSDASDILLVWGDGLCQRYANHRSDLASIPLAETIRLLPDQRRLTTSVMLLGGLTLLVGDDAGLVRAVFVARAPESGTIDGRALVTAHTLRAFDAPVTALGISQRSRIVAVGDERGRIALRSVASDKAIADVPSQGDGASVLAAALVRSEGLVALDAHGGLRCWAMDPTHPDVSVRSLFAKVHYEGQGRAEHTYQSSSASDSAEVKLGLMPLGGAIYTSEFLHPSWRGRIKPTIEMMASLPSVVLGFVAAMVVAPLVRDIVPAFLAGIVLVPMCVLIGAHLWQLAPGPVVARTTAVRRLSMIGLCGLIGIGVSRWAGPAIEAELFQASRSDRLVAAGFCRSIPPEEWPAWVGRRNTMSPDEERRLRADGMYFRGGIVVRPVEIASSADEAKLTEAAQAQGIERGDLLRWLDGSIGGAWPGWFLVLIPLALVLVWILRATTPLRRLDRWLDRPTELGTGLARLIALAVASLAACLAAAIGATMLSGVGLDPRDLMFGPFNQRNSLVVGIIMGFAIIPIIYTISEDAMSSVPTSLRTASLGAGATPWQTAVRVVLPVAASGVFSALMIGLGRAVGETMIVVMATGNTPSMDWSMFSGFRTLSANIAVELPEAPKDGTHYRVLFLCGLVLFVMTFAVNTTAEIVRQRVRRRIASL